MVLGAFALSADRKTQRLRVAKIVDDESFTTHDSQKVTSSAYTSADSDSDGIPSTLHTDLTTLSPNTRPPSYGERSNGEYYGEPSIVHQEPEKAHV